MVYFVQQTSRRMLRTKRSKSNNTLHSTQSQQNQSTNNVSTRLTTSSHNKIAQKKTLKISSRHISTQRKRNTKSPLSSTTITTPIIPTTVVSHTNTHIDPIEGVNNTTITTPLSNNPLAHKSSNHSLSSSLAPKSLINSRQLHPTHEYGSETRPKRQFTPSVVPSNPVVHIDSYLPTHVQYISGYQFLPIPNVKDVKQELYKTLEEYKDVTGRIYIDKKGINLQMCAHPTNTQNVISKIRSVSNNLFKNTRIFANDIVDTNEVPLLFDKLGILERTILNDGLDEAYSDNLNQYIEKFNHLEPAQWHEMLQKGTKKSKKVQKSSQIDPNSPDTNITASDVNVNDGDDVDVADRPIVLDIRNLYEYELGSFEAIAVDVDAYRDTFAILDTLLGIEHQGKKPYITEDEHRDEKAKIKKLKGDDTSEMKKAQIGENKIGKKISNLSQQHQPDLIQRTKLKRGDNPGDVRNIDRGMELSLQQQTLEIGKKLQSLYPPKKSQLLDQDTKLSQIVAEKDNTDNKAIVNIDKDKKLMLYCTGGIRCLKVGSYLHNLGFTDVNVLNGGINAYSVYAQKNPEIVSDENNLFSGSNVVFDHRRAITVGGAQILSLCHQCGTEPTNIQRNCAECDVLFLQCKSCEDLYADTCSLQCSEDHYGLGEYTAQVVKAMGLKPIITPPNKNTRIRPRLQPYSITQHAPYLNNIDIINAPAQSTPVQEQNAQ